MYAQEEYARDLSSSHISTIVEQPKRLWKCKPHPARTHVIFLSSSGPAPSQVKVRLGSAQRHGLLLSSSPDSGPFLVHSGPSHSNLFQFKIRGSGPGAVILLFPLCHHWTPPTQDFIYRGHIDRKRIFWGDECLTKVVHTMMDAPQSSRQRNWS